MKKIVTLITDCYNCKYSRIDGTAPCQSLWCYFDKSCPREIRDSLDFDEYIPGWCQLEDAD